VKDLDELVTWFADKSMERPFRKLVGSILPRWNTINSWLMNYWTMIGHGPANGFFFLSLSDGRRGYEFMHRSFAEFLAARFLASASNRNDGGGWTNPCLAGLTIYLIPWGGQKRTTPRVLVEAVSRQTEWLETVLFFSEMTEHPFPLLEAFSKNDVNTYLSCPLAAILEQVVHRLRPSSSDDYNTLASCYNAIQGIINEHYSNGTPSAVDRLVRIGSACCICITELAERTLSCSPC